MRKNAKQEVIRRSTPIATIPACELAGGKTIIGRSGEIYQVKEARKRNGVVRCQIDGFNRVIELPRTAPVNVYAS